MNIYVHIQYCIYIYVYLYIYTQFRHIFVYSIPYTAYIQYLCTVYIFIQYIYLRFFLKLIQHLAENLYLYCMIQYMLISALPHSQKKRREIAKKLYSNCLFYALIAIAAFSLQFNTIITPLVDEFVHFIDPLLFDFIEMNIRFRNRLKKFFTNYFIRYLNMEQQLKNRSITRLKIIKRYNERVYQRSLSILFIFI